MESREKIIKEYFNCWINKDISILEIVFHKKAKYVECYGPAYAGVAQIKLRIKYLGNLQNGVEEIDSNRRTRSL